MKYSVIVNLYELPLEYSMQFEFFAYPGLPCAIAVEESLSPEALEHGHIMFRNLETGGVGAVLFNAVPVVVEVERNQRGVLVGGKRIVSNDELERGDYIQIGMSGMDWFQIAKDYMP